MAAENDPAGNESGNGKLSSFTYTWASNYAWA
jgi:hypothetical protein